MKTIEQRTASVKRVDAKRVRGLSVKAACKQARVDLNSYYRWQRAGGGTTLTLQDLPTKQLAPKKQKAGRSTVAIPTALFVEVVAHLLHSIKD